MYIWVGLKDFTYLFKIQLAIGFVINCHSILFVTIIHLQYIQCTSISGGGVIILNYVFPIIHSNAINYFMFQLNFRLVLY